MYVLIFTSNQASKMIYVKTRGAAPWMIVRGTTKVTRSWELMDPQTKNNSDKTQDIGIPFDPLTAHKIDILIKQLLCQFEGLLVF